MAISFMECFMTTVYQSLRTTFTRLPVLSTYPPLLGGICKQ
uniref:Uncharacterized protein n=1 Tax=Yersinia enterocolitica W22703 TaxID=913028 RepID=F4MZA3_YEREN|nr:unknown protein [Yersinia enterocolitica W22703]